MWMYVMPSKKKWNRFIPMKISLRGPKCMVARLRMEQTTLQIFHTSSNVNS